MGARRIEAEGAHRVRLAVTSRIARAAEESAVARGVPLSDLMERAGAAVAAEVSALAPSGRVVVVAGSGNNGGDGWVAARCLAEARRDVAVLALAPPDALREPALGAARAALHAGVPWSEVAGADATLLSLSDIACIVDALLGVGLHDAPREPIASLIEAVNDSDALVVSVDVPSGVAADTGGVPGIAVRADATVTFGWAKAGLVLEPGATHAGAVVVADIGLSEPDDLSSALEVWDWAELAALVPIPAPGASKYSRGRLLVVGGSPGMTGAVVLAAQGALRMGAGYVTVAVPTPSLPVVECMIAAPVKLAIPAGGDGELGEDALECLMDAASKADAVVIGPGLGRHAGTAATVAEFVRRVSVPVVVDADALWALGPGGVPRERPAATVITPHAGEAARLLDVTSETVNADRPAAARALAGGGVVGVLKGPRTLVSDGERCVVTMTGGPSLATLGTGDVLAGMTGALLAQGLDPLAAGALAAHLHGAAGDAAARELTPVCCTAPDVLTYLPEAVRALL